MLGREKTVVRGSKDESDLVQGTGIVLRKTRSVGSMAEGGAEGPPELSLPPVACRRDSAIASEWKRQYMPPV